MVDIRNLYPGDKVKIVDEWCEGCGQSFGGEMDIYLGSIMTVREVIEGEWVRMIEDEEDVNFYGGWYWYPAAIDYVIEENDDCDGCDDVINAIDDFMKQFAVK